ncbi:MAG: cyclic nucleotide-binding domain-containing protein [Deltaproteobacteria bacterium]|nr:cyclic nucleotide-binding domain-containing protein [Deltaproteobacteria bacterium]
MNLYDMIDVTDLFKYFTDDEKKEFCEMDHLQVEFKNGDLIIEEGETTKSLYIILEGSVLITKKRDEATIRLAKLKSGGVFGEMSFFSKKPRGTNVLAHENVLVLKLSETFFESLDPVLQNKIKDYFIEILIIRLDQMNDSIMAISKSLRY